MRVLLRILVIISVLLVRSPHYQIFQPLALASNEQAKIPQDQLAAKTAFWGAEMDCGRSRCRRWYLEAVGEGVDIGMSAIGMFIRLRLRAKVGPG